MATQMPDTDELKRESAGETGRVPGNDVGGGGRPSGTPEDQGDPGFRPGGAHPGGSPGSKEGGAGNPSTGGQSGARQPRGDEPIKP